MRTLKLQMQTSVDGYVAGTNGELDWMTWNWDDALNRHVTELNAAVDCMLLGRGLAQGFIPYWEARLADPENTEEFARQAVETPKVVFSKTIEKSEWNNTTLASGDLVEEVNALKQQSGGDIMTYGGAGFASELIRHGLIDELHLFVNPTAIGTGMAIFRELTTLKLVQAKAFECGIVALQYAPLR